MIQEKWLSTCQWPWWVLTAAALFGLTDVHAQTIPDAGSLRQQIEPPRSLTLPQAAPPQRVTPPPEIRPPSGLSVQVKAFRFAGNRLVDSEALTSALAGFVGRKLAYEGLLRAADAVAAVYREAGWIARVYLPEQDVSEGTITLQVVEARFAGVRLEGAPPKRVGRAELEAFFAAAQKTDQPLNADKLDRALLLADDLPGVSLAGTLAPDVSEGRTALVLQTTDEPLVYGDVGLDNTGARATGSQRLTVNLNINSPGGRGELISLTGLHTQGSDYGRVAVTVPVGYDGLRLGGNLSSMLYKVVEGPGVGTSAQVKGRSGSMGLDLNYPLLRARAQNLYLLAGLDNKTFYTGDTQVRSDYASNGLRLGLSANRFDEWVGGGANSAWLQWSVGKLTDMQAHSLIDSIDRLYRKWSYSLSRQQAVSDSHSVQLAVQGQHANQSLDSSEKFYIGGAQSVRAYPASELGGERGRLLSAEWRWRLDKAWLLTAFVDHGRVVGLPATSGELRTDLRLQGHGLSATWQGLDGVMAKLSYSRRDGPNPRPTAAGTDSDGTLKLNRLWFNLSLSF